MTDYQILKAYGFSPAKAAEISLDAERGVRHAKWWLRLARNAALIANPEERAEAEGTSPIDERAADQDAADAARYDWPERCDRVRGI